MRISNRSENENSDQERLGLVIASHPYRDSDLILTMLIKDLGKCSILARGARKSKHRFFGGIEIFECGSFMVSKVKKGKFLQIDALSKRIHLPGLRNNLFSFQAASLILEVTQQILPEEDPESANLLPLLIKTLRFLSNDHDTLRGIAIVCYCILELSKHEGIDPTSELQFFREDDLTWFTTMLKKKDIRTYEPKEASKRALGSLTTFIERALEVKLKSSSFLF
jgi:recombinational DNA repair protein (RecF pathway)